MSSSNSSSSPNGDELIAEQWIRMIGALSYGLLATISLAMNSLLALIFIKVLSPIFEDIWRIYIFKGHQFFQRTAFYAIAWQLVLCDICAQLIQMGIAVPITWTGQMASFYWRRHF